LEKENFYIFDKNDKFWYMK